MFSKGKPIFLLVTVQHMMYGFGDDANVSLIIHHFKSLVQNFQIKPAELIKDLKFKPFCIGKCKNRCMLFI